MENAGWIMPTHIIAAVGIVINEKDEVLMVKTQKGEFRGRLKKIRNPYM
ncbi:hypothetical protein [Eisenbergiella sp.]